MEKNLSDSEKTVIAKKNLLNFYNRLEQLNTDFPVDGIVAFIYADGSTNSDSRWDYHSITPTKLYRFIRSTNSTTKPRNKWLKEIVLPKSFYEKLLSHTDYSAEQVFIKGVLITYV